MRFQPQERDGFTHIQPNFYADDELQRARLLQRKPFARLLPEVFRRSLRSAKASRLSSFYGRLNANIARPS